MVCSFRLLVSNEGFPKRTDWPRLLLTRSKEGKFQQPGLLVLAQLWRILSPPHFVLLLLLAGIRSFQLLGFRIDSTWGCSYGSKPNGHRTNEQIPFYWPRFAHTEYSRLFLDILPDEP
jgi:hypothetical protein